MNRTNSLVPSHNSSSSASHPGLGLFANLNSRRSSLASQQLQQQQQDLQRQNSIANQERIFGNSTTGAESSSSQQRSNHRRSPSPAVLFNPQDKPNFATRTTNQKLNDLLAQQQQDLSNSHNNTSQSAFRVRSSSVQSSTPSAYAGISKVSSASPTNTSGSPANSMKNQQQQQQNKRSSSLSADLPPPARLTRTNTLNSNNQKTNNSSDSKYHQHQHQHHHQSSTSQPVQPYRTWTDIKNSSKEHVHAAAANSAWVAKTTKELQDAIQYVSTENSMMEEVLSEPHHIVSNNDLANIMKSVLSAASDSKSSSIMQHRKPPVLRCIARAKQGASLVATSNTSNTNNNKPNSRSGGGSYGATPSTPSTTMPIIPIDRSGTEYLPFASSAVPYAALQQEQRDMIQRNKERQAGYDRMILDVERQQMSFHEQFAKL